MDKRLYLYPIGLIYGPTAKEAIEQQQALPLCGNYQMAFTHCELIERQSSDRISKNLLTTRELVRSVDPCISSLLDHITASRADFAGLSLDQPRIMGIVNTTPDSFSDGGRLTTAEAAVEHAKILINQGADVIDIGGESTRPGAKPVSIEEEAARVLPVIAGLTGEGTIMSIDTRKVEVMQQAKEAGAHIINDVTALTFSPDSVEVAQKTGLPVILMHAKGNPETMQNDPTYDDVTLDIYDALAERIEVAINAGIAREDIMVDPGIGFGKTFQHNFQLMRQLTMFHGLGVGLLVGASRKGFIGAATGVTIAADRVAGSLAASQQMAMQGVQIIRVHDVAETRQMLDYWLCNIGQRQID